jgi:hypothetical protein
MIWAVPRSATGSDKTRYVTHGVNVGAPDRPYAWLPQSAAGVLRCTTFMCRLAALIRFLNIAYESLARSTRVRQCRPSLEGGAPDATLGGAAFGGCRGSPGAGVVP